MPNVVADNVFVILCDWRGEIVWISTAFSLAKVGDLAWSFLTPESQLRAKEAHSKVASLRETHTLLVENQEGKHFRCWLWPLDSPAIAVCGLGREVPAKLSELTERESECLAMLALGTDTNEIARKLDVSVSTIHTHLKNAREKLEIPSIEALISFAARYCYPPDHSLTASDANEKGTALNGK